MAAIPIARFLLGLGLISCFISINANEYIPVFMWESSSESKKTHSTPALSKISSNDFQDILTAKLHQKDIVVVFVEENLSIEDFSWQDSQRRSAFPGLESVASTSESVTFLPNVHSPVHSIRTLGQTWQHIPFTSHSWDDEVSHAKESILLISLNDAKENEDRHHFLKRHDAFMTRVYEDLINKYDSVAAIYTADHPSWVEAESFPQRLRIKREIDYEGELNGTTFYNGSNTIYMFLEHPPLLNDVSLGEPTDVEYGGNLTNPFDATLKVIYATETLTFKFHERPAGYWVIDEVVLSKPAGDVKLNSTQIQAPRGFSYHCGQNITFLSYPENENGSYNYTLVLQRAQIELFFPETGEVLPDDGIRKFHDAYDCTSFFTIGILSGLFVVLIFAWIFGYGILMIMDIRTMDRFDDPKGKTISVNPLE